MIVDNCPTQLEITGLKAIDLQFLSPKAPVIYAGNGQTR